MSTIVEALHKPGTLSGPWYSKDSRRSHVVYTARHEHDGTVTVTNDDTGRKHSVSAEVFLRRYR